MKLNPFLVGLFILSIPYVFWFAAGENSFLLIYDNLDSEFSYIKLLLESGNLFGFDLSGKIPEVMGGLDRSLFRSGFSLTFLFFYLLPPVYAYIINHMVVHIIGYCGMYLLLKKHFIQQNTILVVAISLLFGLLSYSHIQYGIAIAGQPLLLFAFLNILHKNTKPYNWLIITLFPFYSFLPVTLPFFIPILLLIGLWYGYKQKKIPLYFFLGIVLISTVNLLVEFNLIYAAFFSDCVSHRVVWNRHSLYDYELSWRYLLRILTIDFTITHIHPGKLFPASILLSLFIGWWLKVKIPKLAYVLLITLFLNAFWTGINMSLVMWGRTYFDIFNTFNFQRFFYCAPFVWLLLLGLILKNYNYKKEVHIALALMFVLQTGAGILIKNIEFSSNYKLYTQKKIEVPTFKQFYDQQLFTTIKNYIGTDSINNQKFLTVGMFPNILQYNGLKTLGGYQNNYHLAYKQEFRKIIQNELAKNDTLQSYFDDWGSRCQVFSAELGKNYMFEKNSGVEIHNLSLNLNQVKKMGGTYIISSVPIEGNQKKGLTFLKSFTTDESFWKLYLFKVK